MVKLGGFLSPLEARKVASLPRARWRLLSPLVFREFVGAPLYAVPEGFVTDFASVPRLPLAFLLAGDKAHEAATLHDWLYTSHQVERAEADRLFRVAIVSLGYSRRLAAGMHLAVRVAGASAYQAERPQSFNVEAP